VSLVQALYNSIHTTTAFKSAVLLAMNCKYSPRDAFQCIAQPDTTLLDCILYLTQQLYDPDISPGSANQCILGDMRLKSNLSRTAVILH